MAELTEQYRYFVRVHSATAIAMDGDEGRRRSSGLVVVVIPWWVNSRTRAEIRRRLTGSRLIHVRDETPPRGRYMIIVPLLVAFLTTLMILKCYCVGFFSTLAVVFFAALIALLVALDDGVNNINSILTWIRISHEVVLKLKQAYDTVTRFHSGDFSGPWFTVGSITRAI